MPHVPGDDRMLTVIPSPDKKEKNRIHTNDAWRIRGSITMNRKKLTATLTAVLCAVSTLAAFPAINTQAAEAVYNDFEVTYNGWHDTEGSVLTAVDGAGFGSIVLCIMFLFTPN